MFVSNRFSSCRGSSLLEVLIAAVVLAIGLLGVSALQITSLRGALSSEYRSLAATFATGLAEKMRANKPGSESYITTPIPAEESEYCDTPPVVVCAMSDKKQRIDDLSICTPAEMAVFDLREMRCDSGVRTLLPAGSLTVANPGPGIYQISIGWLERSNTVNNSAATESLAMTVMLGSVSNVIQN